MTSQPRRRTQRPPTPERTLAAIDQATRALRFAHAAVAATPRTCPHCGRALLPPTHDDDEAGARSFDTAT